MLRQHASMLDSLRAGADQFASYTQQEKDFTEVLVYAELLERICLSIEDLAKLLHALQLDLPSFLESILTNKNPQNILTGLDQAKWHTILRYAAIDDLPISAGDKLFLGDIRRKNIERLDTVIELSLDFLQLHWPFFLRHKHGNTILYGLGSAQINGERSFMLPAVFNRNHPDKMKGILVSESIYKRWQVYLNSLIQFSQRLVDRTIVFIETDGKPFAEYEVYYPLQGSERQQMEQILGTCNANVRRTNVNVNIEATLEPQLLRKFSDFYAKFDHSLIH
jgi:hypothetical protein